MERQEVGGEISDSEKLGENSKVNKQTVGNTQKSFVDDIEKLNKLLTDKAAMDEFQASMAARVEQATKRAQERFAPFFGQNSDFAAAVNGMGIISELASNPYTSEMQQDALQTIIDSANNPHRTEMQEAAYNAITESANNPHMAEMQALAEQTVNDCFNNSHWQEMQQLAFQTVVDSAKNPYWAAAQQLTLQSVVDSAKNPHWEKMAAEARNTLFGHPDQSSEKADDVVQEPSVRPAEWQEISSGSQNLKGYSPEENTQPQGLATTATAALQKCLTPEDLKGMIISAKTKVLMQQDPLFENLEEWQKRLSNSSAGERSISNITDFLASNQGLGYAMSFINEQNERSILNQKEEIRRKCSHEAEKWFREKEAELMQRKELVGNMENNLPLSTSILYQSLYLSEQNTIISYENEKSNLWIKELSDQLGNDRRLNGLITDKVGDSQEEYQVPAAWYKWVTDLLSDQEKTDAIIDAIPLLLSKKASEYIPPMLYLAAKGAKDVIYDHMRATLDKGEPYNASVDSSRATAIVKQVDPHQAQLLPGLLGQTLSCFNSNGSTPVGVIKKDALKGEGPIDPTFISETERKNLGGR